MSVTTDGYADATLGEHLAARLFRIFTTAVIAAAIALPRGFAMGLAAST